MLLKYIKIYHQEIPVTGRNVIDFLCMSLYTDYLFGFYKNFQAVPTYDSNNTKFDVSAITCFRVMLIKHTYTQINH